MTRLYDLSVEDLIRLDSDGGANCTASHRENVSIERARIEGERLLATPTNTNTNTTQGACSRAALLACLFARHRSNLFASLQLSLA